ATPTALMVGSGLGAENGVLIRKGEAIQVMKDVDAIVLDKTGTITEGQPAVTDVIALNGMDGEEMINVAASAESGSEHPLGQAIVEYAKSTNGQLSETDQFEAITGKGIRAEVKVGADFKKVLVGTRKLLKESDITLNESIEKQLSDLEKQAKTAMLLAIGGEAA